MLIPMCFALIYMSCVLLQMYSFARAKQRKLDKRERELKQRQAELDKIEQWLDKRYERIERITNREIRI